MEQLLISDLEGLDSAKGSSNVYALTNNQRHGTDKTSKEANGSWDVLHEALWRTPFIDYADEWISIAMFSTNQFLVRAFNKAIQNSNNGRKFNMILLNDKNWTSYDKHIGRTRGKINLVE